MNTSIKLDEDLSYGQLLNNKENNSKLELLNKEEAKYNNDINNNVALQITKIWLLGSKGLKNEEVLSHEIKCLPGKWDLFLIILDMEW